MNPDPASLDNLRDIFEPGPVSWWPPAVGWWFVLAAILFVLVVMAYRAWQQWRANAYRRAALRELRAATSVAAISAILKRTALCAYPRTQVASLSGAAWCGWLVETSGLEISESVIRCLTSGVYGADVPEERRALADFAVNWIRSHGRGRSSSGAPSPFA